MKKTIITAKLETPLKAPRLLRVTSGDWDSGAVPLTNGQTILVPLALMGPNAFKVQILDEENKPAAQEQLLTVNRVVAVTGGIPAAQTIAVKVLSAHDKQKNILHPIVNKGVILPTSGQASFTSARELSAGAGGSISFELFQVEYPERIELNLCVGSFRIGSEDLPTGTTIKAGDPIAFNWQISESGILQASVSLGAGTELKTPRFYAPQTGEISFADEDGKNFAEAVLQQGEEEWGDLTAALGPDGGTEVQLLHTRLVEQREIKEDAADDAETLRHMVEETRFIRQDIARIGRKYRSALLQRRLGKMLAVFNRVARHSATEDETGRFDQYADRVQQIIDKNDAAYFENADLYLGEMRDQFFAIAWRDANYVTTWYKLLVAEPYLFPDKTEFQIMVSEGTKLCETNDTAALRELVGRMLASRITLGACDSASELASIVKN